VIAAVCAAILLPAALAVSGVPSAAAPAGEGHPDVTTLYPAQLGRGADTLLLHTEEKAIVDGRTRIPVRGIPHFWMLGRVGRDYLLRTADEDFEHYAVVLVRRDGSRRVLQRFGDSTASVASADGRHLALVTGDRPDTLIRVVVTRTGKQVSRKRFGSFGVQINGYGVHRMVITGLRSRTYWWNPATRRLTLIVPRPAGADIGANRLVVSIPDPDDPLAECQKTVELSRPSVVLWRSCQDRPLAFSPDGTRMATTGIFADGVGPNVVRVRRQGGQVLRTLRAPMFFGFVEWESNHRLLVQPVGKEYVAAVRCRSRGECVRASRLYPSPGSFDPPMSMLWTFPWT
jgi:hypothetical protein